MPHIKGFVEHIIYRNASNGYTVLNLIPDDPVTDEGLEDPLMVTCVGIFPSVSEGENLEIEGEFTDHESFGRQLKMTRYETIVPKDREAQLRLLSAGVIRGIGPAMAKRIVAKFGDDTLRIMTEEPERLMEVKGIGEKKALEIAEQMQERSIQRQVILELTAMGISTNMAIKIYGEYGDRTLEIVRENPYRLAEDISGIGFQTADEIAIRMGGSTDSDFRICCGIQYVLIMAETNGHTFLPQKELLAQAMELLGVSTEALEANISNMVMDGRLKCRGDAVYRKYMYRIEDEVAGYLLDLDRALEGEEGASEAEIKGLEALEKMTLSDTQRKAVELATQRGVFLLTGGPGTGKTTTIRMMIRYFETMGVDVALAAPTGRAAKRMSEACGRNAVTIHRLLEVNGGTVGDEDRGKSARFERNPDNPLEYDVIIIDEMSMVDISLMYHLVRAIPEGTRLIMVGDENQLPSVGPGNVLRDIISSDCFSVVTLQTIYRQKESGDIVWNAHAIRRGEEVHADNKNSRDFFFIAREDADHILATVRSLVSEKLPKYVDAESFDIQVLSPMRKGNLGVERLNRILQMFLNPADDSKLEKQYGERVFREGDKVMQTKNDYQIPWEMRGKYGIVINEGTGIFNGDLGIIRSINEYNSTMTIEFDDGKMVDYPWTMLDRLEHAYAMTIHKSQGSEYPAVVIPLLAGPRMLYTRNLIYTAITRAQKCVVLVGDEAVFQAMIANNIEAKRYSGLYERLMERMIF